MKKNTDHIIEFLYHLLYVGIFSGAVMVCFANLCGVPRAGWKHMAVLIGMASLLSAVRLFNRRQRFYTVFLGAFVLICLFLSVGSEECLIYFGKVLNVSLTNGEVGEILAGERIYIEFGRVTLLTAACHFVQLILEKNLYIKAISAAAGGGWLLYALFWKRRVPEMGVILLLAYISLTMAEWIRMHWKKMKRGNAHAYVLGIIPFLLLYSLLLSFIPMQENPYGWQWFRNIYRSAEERITMITENFWNGGDEYFGDTFSGFSEKGSLFTSIIPSDKQLMTLGIGTNKEMPVYLTGKIFDSFNGREWISRRHGSIWEAGREDADGSDRVLDAMETVYALDGYTENDKLNYYKNIWMDISYQYFHTNYVMAPSKVLQIGDQSKSIKYHQDGSEFVFDKRAGYGTQYTLRFCQLNMDRAEWYRFLGRDKEEDEVAWNRIVQQYAHGNISMEELYAYRENVKEQYLPETILSPEVAKWFDYITKDAETDLEKLKYLESALADMAYNTNPGELPTTVTDETSFLDYFLLNKREGYCVHFATAFVLLARAEGFPARYVQGFCVPAVSGEKTFVYSDMAHAWPEVYIEGKGWASFEPTPGFGINRYTAWEKEISSNTWSDYTGKPNSQAGESVSSSEREVSEEDISEEQEQNRWLPHLKRVIPVLVIGIILAFIIDWSLEKYRESKRNLYEKYRMAVLHNLQILGMLGYRREQSETFHELQERIRRDNANTGEKENTGKEKDDNKVSCGFIEIYEQHLYGTLEITEEIMQEVLKERKLLLDTLKKRKGKKYPFFRVRLYLLRYR